MAPSQEVDSSYTMSGEKPRDRAIVISLLLLLFLSLVVGLALQTATFHQLTALHAGKTVKSGKFSDNSQQQQTCTQLYFNRVRDLPKTFRIPPEPELASTVQPE